MPRPKQWELAAHALLKGALSMQESAQALLREAAALAGKHEEWTESDIEEAATHCGDAAHSIKTIILDLTGAPVAEDDD